MLDMTISIAKAKKAGDLVAIIACPHGDHKVDLKVGRGFFLIDAADITRKTMEGMLGFAGHCGLRWLSRLQSQPCSSN